MNKKISIIIATFNAAFTIKYCLNSIVFQLTSQCELVIIDGGSSDDTLNIVHEYADYISYLVSEPDKGIYDAWNKGVKAAQGEWIMFIGADDILLPNAINKYLYTINKMPDISTYDYICAHNEYVDADGKLLKILGREPKWNVMRRTMAAAHVASLHNKKNLFETIGGYDLSFKICADYELLLRKKERLKSLFIPEHIAKMKIGGMSFSTQAIIETYNIRKLHYSVSFIMNLFLFIRDYIGYKLFSLHKS